MGSFWHAHYGWAGLVSLITLAGLEIILGIDNLVFISILSSKLPANKQALARKLGLTLAVVTRIALLLTITEITKLTKPLLSLGKLTFSGKDLILLIGGLFLIAKSTFEIHDKLESAKESETNAKTKNSLLGVVIQIMFLDIIFSLDSVIIAVGISQNLWVMIPAVLLATAVMVLASNLISHFIQKHPSLKMLALSFLILIGVVLVAEGFGKHIEHEYLYFAIAFSLGVEFLNIKLRKKSAPVKLRHTEIS